MLYIHKLADLTLRTADTESTYIIRELKQRIHFPFSAEMIEESIGEHLVSETDLKSIENALSLVEPTIAALQAMLQERNALHEAVNVQRAVKLLETIPRPLSNNLAFSHEMFAQQSELFQEAAGLFNALPKAKTKEEKAAVNAQIGTLFEKVLRNGEFSFRFADVVNEGQTTALDGLEESLRKGFLFHVTLEEELQKKGFDVIKKRLPADKIGEADLIEQNIGQIAKGVRRAYQLNHKMINWAVLFYSMVKWVNTDIKG